MADARDRDVHLLLLDDKTVLAVDVENAGGTGDDSAVPPGLSFDDLAKAVGPLIGAVLHRGGVSGAQLYELSPESRKMLRGARLDKVGSYFRGVLRDSKGHASHQVQLREAKPVANGPSLYDVTAAIQMAAIQAQLTRIENTLDELTISVDRVRAFLEGKERAHVIATLMVLRDVHARTLRTGTLSSVDWERISALEVAIEAQLQYDVDDLQRRISRARFNGAPKHDERIMKELAPARVRELVETHQLMLSGLRQWHELMLVRKYEAGEFDEFEAKQIRKRLRQRVDEHVELLAKLKKVAKESRKASPRGYLERLMTDGIVLGGNMDKDRLQTVKKGRRVLKTTVKQGRLALAPAPQRRELVIVPAPKPPVARADDQAGPVTATG